MKKIILHLCADTGSDSAPYSDHNDYTVIKIGSDIGVENYNLPMDVYGIIANPVCTEFSTAKGFHLDGDYEKGMEMVRDCQRIIKNCNPTFWVIENPANGKLKDFLGTPSFTYQPWQFGSPWTKKTSLWGEFNIPRPLFTDWNDVPKNDNLYTRPGRPKPSLAFMHKSHIDVIPEFKRFKDTVNSDAEFRSLCSQGFAMEFFKVNR